MVAFPGDPGALLRRHPSGPDCASRAAIPSGCSCVERHWIDGSRLQRDSSPTGPRAGPRGSGANRHRSSPQRAIRVERIRRCPGTTSAVGTRRLPRPKRLAPGDSAPRRHLHRPRHLAIELGVRTSRMREYRNPPAARNSAARATARPLTTCWSTTSLRRPPSTESRRPPRSKTTPNNEYLRRLASHEKACSEAGASSVANGGTTCSTDDFEPIHLPSHDDGGSAEGTTQRHHCRSRKSRGSAGPGHCAWRRVALTVLRSARAEVLSLGTASSTISHGVSGRRPSVRSFREGRWGPTCPVDGEIEDVRPVVVATLISRGAWCDSGIQFEVGVDELLLSRFTLSEHFS